MRLPKARQVAIFNSSRYCGVALEISVWVSLWMDLCSFRAEYSPVSKTAGDPISRLAVDLAFFLLYSK